MQVIFDQNVSENIQVQQLVEEFLSRVSTLEMKHKMPVVIFQDGVKGSYYIKCSISAQDAARLCDLNAKLDINNLESYKANRNLLLKNITYLKMETDALSGREFNDIIVEYNTVYDFDTPLKVWGGQHRISAISKGGKKTNRYHGFRVYFNLSTDQRTELALISNTNIAVSNDTFDRMVEETMFGNALRDWCQRVGLLEKHEDFPDVGSRSEKITVKRARSFIVNFYFGKAEGNKLTSDKLDHQVHEPYLTITGVIVDPKYQEVMNNNDILLDDALIRAGEQFVALHNAQYKAVINPGTKIQNRKSFRNKALIESVLCGWSYIAGLLQKHPERLDNHYRLPETSRTVPDPLNAEEMSKFKYDSAEITSRGLGTRSAPKDRQRIAQLFLAKSLDKNVTIDKKLMFKAVAQVEGLRSLSKGYTP